MATQLDREVAAIQTRIVAEVSALAAAIEAQLDDVSVSHVALCRPDAVSVAANLRALANLCGGAA